MTQADDELVFAEETAIAGGLTERPENAPNPPWKLLVVDDEREVHAISRLALRGLRFRDREILCLSAYSGTQARSLLQEHPDIAVILLDVVMETETAGLDLVRHIRCRLGNRLVQIILRTGQPGSAPESRVILDYEINDYKDKTELTAQKLSTVVLTSLRAYELGVTLETRNNTLARMMAASLRFVPTQSLELLGKTSLVDIVLGDQVQREMAILFADIRQFTRICERLTPGETFEFLNVLWGRLAPVIRQHGGFIDKYLGDGILALFPGTVDAALDAGTALLRCLSEYNRAEGREVPVRMGMGIHCGSLMLGIVGEPERLEATVLADAVNTGSRLEALTKEYGVDILISEEAVARITNPVRYRFRYVDKVKLRGRLAEITVYELLDRECGGNSELKFATQAEFEQGLNLYRARRFAESSVYFSRVLERNPADAVVRIYLERAADYMVRGVPAEWPGCG